MAASSCQLMFNADLPSGKRVKMTVPRKLQISLEQTPYYHCVSRCVRRAYLCGRDEVSGRDYEHRRQWIEDRIAELCKIFSIDIVAYAIMHNHFHLVVRVCQERADGWSDAEVAQRWGAIFSLPAQADVTLLLPRWRERLTSISWLMRCLNEPLARRANKEDNCTGRFWEGRFKLQALLDEEALLKCMIYVDLNPIRAGIASGVEHSDYTSAKARLEGRDSHLIALDDSAFSNAESLDISCAEYLEVVEWTGQIIRSDKRGYITSTMPTIVDRLRIDERRWIREIKHYGKWYYRAVGSIATMEMYCSRLQQRWLKGMSQSRLQPARMFIFH
jgi:putative transposase